MQPNASARYSLAQSMLGATLLAALLLQLLAARRPHWSWATFGDMTYVHACNSSGPWSDAALRTLAKFPLVTLERFHGQYTHCACHSAHSPSPCCAPEEGPTVLFPTARGAYVEDYAVPALRAIKNYSVFIVTAVRSAVAHGFAECACVVARATELTALLRVLADDEHPGLCVADRHPRGLDTGRRDHVGGDHDTPPAAFHGVRGVLRRQG